MLPPPLTAPRQQQGLEMHPEMKSGFSYRHFITLRSRYFSVMCKCIRISTHFRKNFTGVKLMDPFSIPTHTHTSTEAVRPRQTWLLGWAGLAGVNDPDVLYRSSRRKGR